VHPTPSKHNKTCPFSQVYALLRRLYYLSRALEPQHKTKHRAHTCFLHALVPCNACATANKEREMECVIRIRSFYGTIAHDIREYSVYELHRTCFCVLG